MKPGIPINARVKDCADTSPERLCDLAILRGNDLLFRTKMQEFIRDRDVRDGGGDRDFSSYLPAQLS